MTTDSSPLELVSKWFDNFSEVLCKSGLPLYETIARGLAADDEMLELAVNDRGQPPHLLLAAVHFLLLKGAEHPLREFYPNLTSSPSDPSHVYETFRNFCTLHSDRLRLLVESNFVQTNEVGRCSYLCLAFGMLSERTGKRPLSLIEVGTRAGLNLLWDKYTFRFPDTARYGDPSSPVGIQSEFRGESRPRLPAGIPEIVFRRGIDVHPLDVNKEDDALWLRALVWPEDRQRAAILEKAMAVRREFPVEIIEGDGKSLVRGVIEETPKESLVCVFHTHTSCQWPKAEREKFLGILSAASGSRDLRLLSAESQGGGFAKLVLTSWKKGKQEDRLLANVHDHGCWIEWLDPS